MRARVESLGRKRRSRMSIQAETHRDSPHARSTDFDAVVVGAGFSGLRMLQELRRLGLSARVIEAGSDVGGTWYWNRYPGARVDSQSWVYAYSFSEDLQQNWRWNERYPAQPETLSYLEHVANQFDLRRDVEFDTKVQSAQFDDAAPPGPSLRTGGSVTPAGTSSQPQDRCRSRTFPTSTGSPTSRASGSRPRGGRKRMSTSPASG
jgi:hypothetical protein